MQGRNRLHEMPGWAQLPLVAVGVGVMLSTQVLFQPFVWRHWPVDEVAWAWLEILRDRLVVAGGVALACVAVLRTHPRPGSARAWMMALAAAIGATAGEAVLMAFDTPAAADDAAELVERALRWTCVAAALGALDQVRRRALEADALVRGARAAEQASQAQAAQLHLQALRAQIEPHFLFNTLATVQRLTHTDPQLGRALLDDLHTFVRLSAEAGPEAQRWTLSQELDLVRAYLGVVETRMDGRLAVRIGSDPVLLGLDLPPLMVATLVENAVKHGITPSTEAGRIDIQARRDGTDLLVTVADTGVGFRATSGSGIGLANTRARLRTQFGAQASLTLSANVPHGVLATLRMPAAVPKGRTG
jgi:hypothetical protein